MTIQAFCFVRRTLGNSSDTVIVAATPNAPSEGGRAAMHGFFIKSGLVLITSIVIHAGQASTAYAQQATIKRTDLATADQSAADVGALWVADIPPGGATGRHTHPTPRFVYVLEGSVILEIDGKPVQTFKSGEGFAEPPGVVHNFRNASTTSPAKALGFQVAPKGVPLQANVQ
jgi:quercetin dioxygenase-like cupin family protein